MKMWIYAMSTYSFLMFLVIGCSEGAQLGVKTHIDPDPGVNVGNGNKPVDEKEYRSSFNFMIRYHKDLTLTESENKKQVTIDNRTLVDRNTTSSAIKFDVLEPEKDYTKFSSSTDLKKHIAPMTAWAEKKYPGKKFVPASFPGASGIFFEERETGKLISRYFVLTTNFLLIQVEIDAYVAGNGLAWVAPIVHTFTADTVPPEIKELRASGSCEAGKKCSFEVRVTDYYSGVGNYISFMFRPVAGGEALINKGSSIRALGGDWYSLEFELDAFKPAGQYYLSDIWVWDKAENSRRYDAPTGSDHALSGTTYKETPLEVLKILVIK